MAKRSNIKLTIGDMRCLAVKKGGVCISTTYLGNKVKISIREVQSKVSMIHALSPLVIHLDVVQ